MLSPQEISDRIEIDQVLARYCHAVDERDWQTYRIIFTEDAVIDDVVTGGIRSGVEDHVGYLQRALRSIRVSQHTISTILLDVEGDSATAKVQCICPMMVAMPEGATQTMILGVRYRDRLSRVNGGWRISELIEENFWHLNVPEGFKFRADRG
jgi:ketosteroid isomerase-like protein